MKCRCRRRRLSLGTRLWRGDCAVAADIEAGVGDVVGAYGFVCGFDTGGVAALEPAEGFSQRLWM